MTTCARRLRVEGVVQGVGFRPFVYAAAVRRGLTGFVGNDSEGVFVEVEGPATAVDALVNDIRTSPPPLAIVDRVWQQDVPPRGAEAFRIVDSRRGPEHAALIAPDTATCADCLAEMRDPGNRRYRYPFINCTNCGPRFTIVRDVPYDRPNTTMASFAMCSDCAAEYADPADRRYHAQPVCCPACGPTLRLVGVESPDPLTATADLLRAGRIVAIKGLGGFHLAAVARQHDAVRALRSRKHREDKPFAVMVPDLLAAMKLAEIDDVAAALLTDRRRPIVLLPRRPAAPLADAVAPRTSRIGLMLPYTPLHHLLAEVLGEPFVLTSGNVSDEPIAYRDGDALARLAGIADAFLLHDRRIETRTDDSVVRLNRTPSGARPYPIRRSRGYVPAPLTLARPLAQPVLGVGAELKNTFCLGKGNRAFLSHHIGDLENVETLRSFHAGIAHFRRLFDVEPKVIAHDLHPEYLSTKYAMDADLTLVAVQHHHAHIASCLTDNGVAGPVIGVAFDGLGMGTDGTLWGGEFLLADLEGFTRAAHLPAVTMPGGAAAIRQPWRMAAAWLDVAFEGQPPELAVQQRHSEQWALVLEAARAGVNAPLTSSMGRLFDAVSAIAGVRDEVAYEGQAAVELEQLAAPDERGTYGTDVPELIRAVAHDALTGVDTSCIAARFHNSLVELVHITCQQIRNASGVSSVALSGGVWQNELLLDRTTSRLEEAGFSVLVHERVPCNDGGISLGQVAVAGSLS